jgi:hypothetical protein
MTRPASGRSDTGHAAEPVCRSPAARRGGRPVRHRVAVLALDQVIGFDLGTAPQVLGAARDAVGNQLYSVRVATPGRRPVRSRPPTR